MNIFRLVADLMHLASIFILLLKIYKTKSASGISFKSQVLYVVVFCTRYLDIFTNYVSIYNTVMKIFFLCSSIFIVYLMKFKLQATWQPSLDTFKVEFLIIPSAILALIFNHKFTILEILWSFSIYLESVAILPQLFQLQRTGEAESITSHYLFALGGYRALYIINWIYRYFAEGFYDWIAIIAGIVQTLLYSDFLYLYITK
ncbi:ER lumen protein retaining receptor [Neocallimastix californiae]|uniref:ER lumen protein-retaining receptor n=1 Tax=Neocallimastix californiae TaxID=1754190 RepID=A0A1Y1Z7D2_9FUNG|nr:ER lumen protein retaining receptor [Neocallimastix californiae]|eukprot:ORY06169.1 ER lumen protein retaining receptor [Neocallimastix californiae]